MKKIILYDDEEGVAQKYVERLRKVESIRTSFQVETVGDKDFETALNRLKARQDELRQGGKIDDGSCILDEASIFIIDYDIWKGFNQKSFLTGEEVAYHCRCFSKCGLIIGLNQYNGTNVFDLTLKGHPESYADLNIWSRQLDNPGLWSEERDEFRPWYWPQLPTYLESFEKKTTEIAEHLNESIADFLGFGNIIQVLSKFAKAFIGGDPSKTTFSKFVTSSGNGLRPKDKNENPELIARIAVSRISKWMERMALPGQDVLVDAPHLVSRYPSLLIGDHSSIDTWNTTTRLSTHEQFNLDHEKIEEFRFKNDLWLSRPAWLWVKLADSQAIKEVSKPWEKERVDFVFCEDSSRFFKRKVCTEFLAEVDSPYTRRFIRRFKNVEYLPITNLM